MRKGEGLGVYSVRIEWLDTKNPTNPRNERNLMTIKELKKLVKQYNQEAVAEIPQLEKNAQDAGSCWQSEKLGYAKGYAQALKEMLSKI
jgi:uncharacterized protein YaaR (DUF327 family)